MLLRSLKAGEGLRHGSEYGTSNHILCPLSTGTLLGFRYEESGPLTPMMLRVQRVPHPKVAPWTLNPKPSTLNPKILHPRPSTLNPPNPTPSSLP